jgi:hypothetical protein
VPCWSFAEREEAALRSGTGTAGQTPPAYEFIDAIVQLEKQVLQQRVDELQQQQRTAPDDADKQECANYAAARYAKTPAQARRAIALSSVPEA